LHFSFLPECRRIGDEESLAIASDPTPGITVIHGPNGAGKSSIADAIETALQGRVRSPALQARGDARSASQTQ
jgi:DNA repair exonuclease SbcCD ATPase subunit